MNCQDANPLLSAARDGELSESQRAALERHVSGCAACQQVQASWQAAAEALRAEAAQVRVPDAEIEWHRLEARLATPHRETRRRVAPVAWFGLPLAAAAAVAVAFFIGQPARIALNSAGIPDGDYARADFVDVADRDATPVVFLDKESGVLVVWSVDHSPPLATSAD
jgi:anti-sigma factor RsiW